MSAETTWARFGAATTTQGLSPGVRDAWCRGRGRYLVWLLRCRDHAVQQRVASVRRALGGAIAAVPDRDLHITLWVLGFDGAAGPARSPLDDDVAPEVVDAQRAALQAALHAPGAKGTAALPAPALALGGADSFTSTAFMTVLDPSGWLARVRAVLAPHHDELRFSPYHPHLSVGAYVADLPTAPIVDALRPLRVLPVLPLQVDAIELCAFDGRVPGAPLETVHRVPLAGAGAASGVAPAHARTL